MEIFVPRDSTVDGMAQLAAAAEQAGRIIPAGSVQFHDN